MPALTNSPSDLLKLLTAAGGGRMLSPNTVTGYGRDWKRFDRWCHSEQRSALPADPESVKLYLAGLLSRGRKVSTVERQANAIASRHKDNGLTSPVTRETRMILSNARRLFSYAPRQMEPLTVAQVCSIAKALAKVGSKRAMRDRALITLGFASALRGASLCVLDAEDVAQTAEGLSLCVRKEKNDRVGKPRYIGVPRSGGDGCAVRCHADWLSIRGEAPGALFTRTDRLSELPRLKPFRIRLIVRSGMRTAGLDPYGFSAHSMRAGFVTAAGEAGAGELLIAQQTGHRDMKVLRGYFRRRDLFRANACSLLKL